MAGSLAGRDSVHLYVTAGDVACALLRRRCQHRCGTQRDRNAVSAGGCGLVIVCLAQRSNAPRGVRATAATELARVVFGCDAPNRVFCVVDCVPAQSGSGGSGWSGSGNNGPAAAVLHSAERSVSRMAIDGWRCVFATFRCRSSSTILSPVSELAIIVRA